MSRRTARAAAALGALLALGACGEESGARTHGELVSLGRARACVAVGAETQCFRMTDESRVARSARVGEFVSLRWRAPGRVLDIVPLEDPPARG